jgi:hypothetical protein
METVNMTLFELLSYFKEIVSTNPTGEIAEASHRKVRSSSIIHAEGLIAAVIVTHTEVF